MSTLGVALITLNEEKNIEQCLSSVSSADEIVVVDSHSTDRTVAIAQRCGAKTIVRDFQGYSKEKQFAVDQLETDWILALDADERLTEELQQEVSATIARRDALDAYELRRTQVFMARYLRYGRGIDHPLRLFRKGKARYDGQVLHESIVCDGTIGRLSAALIHYSSSAVADRLNKIRNEISRELALRPRSAPVSKKELFCNPPIYFLSYMIKKSVWRDGVPGVTFHLLFALQILLQHSMDYERQILPEKTE